MEKTKVEGESLLVLTFSPSQVVHKFLEVRLDSSWRLAGDFERILEDGNGEIVAWHNSEI